MGAFSRLPLAGCFPRFCRDDSCTTQDAPMTNQRSSAGGSEPTVNLKAEIKAAAGHGFRYYVYTLSDTQGVFYVGKGKGARVFQHEQLLPHERNAAKITRLVACDLEPAKAIVAFFRAEDDAYAFERTLIAEGSNLTNATPGRRSSRDSAVERANALLARLSALTGPLADALRARVQELARNPNPVSVLVRPDGSSVWRY
jgi:hypothetical protein